MSLLVLIICSLCALLIEAFFSGSEMALISVDKVHLRRMVNEGNSGAKKALQLLKHPEHIITTTLLGTNLAVAFQAAIFTSYLHDNLGDNYGYLSIVILTPITLLFGEIFPKSIFQHYSNFIAPKVADIINVVRIILSPCLWLLLKYTNWISNQIQPLEKMITGHTSTTHREELGYLLTYGRKEVSLKPTERKMIRRILDFSKSEARNALVPLINVDTIEDTSTVEDAIAAFEKFGRSRLPVFHDRVDNVVGILDVFDVLVEKDTRKTVTHLMQQAHFAPETQQLDELLSGMKARNIQLFVIVDEYGGAVGIITIEDILEEIVGEIQDEGDPHITEFSVIREGEYIVRGRMEIDAINEHLKLQLPRGHYETLAGFLLQQFNRIPEEEDELYYRNLKFIVLKASNRAIQQVKIQHLK